MINLEIRNGVFQQQQQEIASSMALTKVVLLCIQNKKQQNITHDQIYKHFQPIVQLNKILIFEKSQIWKIFLEVKNKEQTQRILKNCNNAFLNGDQYLRMQAYSSNLESVTFSESNNAGKDYTKVNTKRDSFNSTDDESNSISVSEEQSIINNSIKNNQQTTIQQSTYQYQQVLSQKLYEQQVLHMRLQTQVLDLQGPEFLNAITSTPWIEQFTQIVKLLQTQYLLEYQLVETYLNYIKQESLNVQQELIKQQIQKQEALEIPQIQKSRVLSVKSIDDSQVTMEMLYNLFSIYGNINKMLFQKDKSQLLIEYNLQKCSDQCIEKLNGIVFQGQKLEINYSLQQELVFLDELEEMGFVEKAIYEERFVGSEATNRYKPKNSFVAAPPNDTVFLMNLPDELMNIDSFKDIIEGTLVEYKFYEDAKQKHSCALKFQNIEQALLFLAKNHGKVMADRKILMTFSKKPM